ncbi:kinase-like domain-containing protein [Dactylonectria macrodidyma]|uniref:Kinase-like domain-containing protein n=1 Tax=Dactylonectria macrodidyma TaxID=307937 RepID=A0A9P9F4Q4_9HYPO|nr:kinase-like domain-containing protein [Dactylonectria macrodidyma]
MNHNTPANGSESSKINSFGTQGISFEAKIETQAVATIRDPAANASLWTPDDEEHSKIRNREFAPGPFSRGCVLGTGGWCTVYKVRRHRDGAVFAGKMSKFPQQLQKERRILPNLNHDHLIKYADWYEDHANPLGTLLVTELCTGGTLQDRINYSPKTIGRKEALQVISQTAQALGYMHDRNLMHTDVKPRNILIRTWDPVDIVLADCADIKPTTFNGKAVGTEAYWSPYIARFKKHGGQDDDVWALGVTLLGLMAQWPKLHNLTDLKEYPTRCYHHTQSLSELNPHDKLVRLLRRMLVWHPVERATAAECVSLATDMLARIATKETTGNADTAEANEFNITAPEEFAPISFW